MKWANRRHCHAGTPMTTPGSSSELEPFGAPFTDAFGCLCILFSFIIVLAGAYHRAGHSQPFGECNPLGSVLVRLRLETSLLVRRLPLDFDSQPLRICLFFRT